MTDDMHEGLRTIRRCFVPVLGREQRTSGKGAGALDKAEGAHRDRTIRSLVDGPGECVRACVRGCVRG